MIECPTANVRPVAGGFSCILYKLSNLLKLPILNNIKWITVSVLEVKLTINLGLLQDSVFLKCFKTLEITPWLEMVHYAIIMLAFQLINLYVGHLLSHYMHGLII